METDNCNSVTYKYLEFVVPISKWIQKAIVITWFIKRTDHIKCFQEPLQQRGVSLDRERYKFGLFKKIFKHKNGGKMISKFPFDIEYLYLFGNVASSMH